MTAWPVFIRPAPVLVCKLGRGVQQLVIGLTGGIASGKSTVAELFQALAVPVIDADAVARDVVAPGEPALAEIRKIFGRQVFTSTGELDRARLRQIIFTDPIERRRLEHILHPRIHAGILLALTSSAAPYAILMIPLLLESAQDYPVNRILVVDVPKDLQRQRATRRDGPDTRTLDGILQAQAGRDERLARADDIIDNTGSLEDLRTQVARLHRIYLQLAGTELADRSG